jgi:hypothetical protein
MLRALAVFGLLSLIPPCDLALDNPGGSKAGGSYTFTVMSSSVPVKVQVTAGGEVIWSGEAKTTQEAITIDVPEAARGKALEILAENPDGCVVAWSETVQ